jgi:TetR/AcrR family transcriptional regulator
LAESRNGNIRHKNKALILNAAKRSLLLSALKERQLNVLLIGQVFLEPIGINIIKNKTDLYLQLLNNIIDVWNKNLSTLDADHEPKTA